MLDNDIVKLLSSNPIFAGLEQNDLQALASIGEVESFAIGQVICNQGEIDGDAFLVFSGRARAIKESKNRKPLTLGVLGRGDFFGEYTVLTGEPRMATVRASDETLVIRFSRQALQTFLTAHPQLENYFKVLLSDRALVSFLRSDTIFRSVPPTQLRAILEKLQICNYESGQTLFSEGQDYDRFYIVQQGEVRLEKIIDGEMKTLDFISSGGCFGELGLIKRSKRYASAVATTETRCLALEYGAFNAIIEQQPKLKQALEERIEAYHDRALVAGFKPVSTVTGRKEQPLQLNKEESSEKPGDAAFQKQKFRFNKYPWIRQNDETDCGAACLGMISRFYGKRIALTRIRDLANVGAEGASMHSLAQAAESLGYSTRPVRTDYAHLKSLAMPAIAHWKGYHYVVIYQADDDRVVVSDPAIGVIKIKRKEFEAGWSGYLLILEVTAKFDEQEQQRTTLKKFLPLLKPHTKFLIDVILASLLINLFALATPVFIQTIIDRVLVHQDVQMLNLMLGGMLIVGLFSTLVTLLRYYLLIFVSQKLSLRLSSDLFRQILKLPMRFFSMRKTGDILTRFADNQKVQDLITGSAIKTLLDVLMVIVYLAVMFLYSSELTSIALIFIPLSVIVTLIFTPIMKRNNQRIFEKTATAQSKLIESIAKIETIKALTSELSTRWKYEDMIVENANQSFYGAKLGMLMNAFSGTIQLLSTVVVLWYGAHLVIDGEMSVGQLIAFNTLIGMVMAPVLGLVGMWQTFQDAMLSLQRLNDIYDAEPEELENISGLVQMPAIEGHIQLENVSFRYTPDGDNVLSNISLEIHPGEMIALVGRSGSGKTTLFSLLQRLYKPTEGRILIDGFDIAVISTASLREQVGVVLQESAIFSGTIRENISMSDPDASLERVQQAAKLANAHGFISSFPLGYETAIGEVGIALSGGQRQRLAIARALLKEPRLLLFDEATSALDSESERTIQKNMRAISEGRTSIIIAHRLSTIRNADKIIVLDDGCIIEQGSHRDLLAQKGLYYYLHSQQLGN